MMRMHENYLNFDKNFFNDGKKSSNVYNIMIITQMEIILKLIPVDCNEQQNTSLPLPNKLSSLECLT